MSDIGLAKAKAVIPMYDELKGNLMAQATHFSVHDETSLLLLKAADAIERLDAIAQTYAETVHEIEDKRKWIPVTERLPELGKKVLVFAYGNDTLTARMQKRTENGYPVFECNGFFLEMAKLGRITHWMPLPQPPKDGEP